MSRKGWFILGTVVSLLVLILGLAGTVVYYDNLPENVSQHETLVLGQSRLVPGSTAAMRVVVRDTRDATPLPGSSVKVLMHPAQGGAATTLFEGVADESGNVNVTFTVPEDVDEQQTLVVETRSELGRDELEQPVTLARDYRVLLSTDKPLYQPGQVIHLRVLALGSFDLRPAAEQPLEVTIADGKGNTVFRKTLTTSVYGVAATDFQLASEVNSGPYKISATLGSTVSEKTVTVEHYVLPKFKVHLTTDRDFYRPGDRVAGSIDVNYFFGKPVAGGRVVLEGYTFDFQREVAVTLEGITDAEGHFDFTFELPDYLVGTGLDEGLARFYLEVAVTDQAEHTEVGRHSLPVAQQALIIEAIPEGGQFRPGVENILYVMVGAPDGAPVQADVTVTNLNTGEELTAETGAYGLAEVRFTPDDAYVSLMVSARDASGAEAMREFYFEGAWQEETVLVRPDAPIYRVGETMALTLLTSQQQGTVYVDVVREGQTVSTRAVDVTGGRAEAAVDLTPDLYGTLEVHAYKILTSGNIVRDTRLVVVEQADDLAIALTPGAESYRPGEDAALDVQVRGADGAGVPAALGLAVVDEAVFALAEQDPGFAKLYFMLEAELLEPKYELHGFSVPALMEEYPIEEDPALRDARADAGKATLAAAVQQISPFTLSANSHQQAMQHLYERQETFFSGLASASRWLLTLVSFVILILSGLAAWRAGFFWRSLGASVALFIFLTVFMFGLFWMVQEFFWRAEETILIFLVASLGLVGLVGFITLIVIGVKERDALLGVSLALLPLFFVLVVLWVFAGMRANVYPGESALLLTFLAVLLLPVAFLLRGAQFAFGKRFGSAVAALSIVLFLLISTLPVVAAGAFVGRGGFAVAGAPMMEQGMVADGMVMEEMDMAAEVPAAEPMEALIDGEMRNESATDDAAAPKASGDASPSGAQPPRLRQYFPETMLWLPAEVTDANGDLHLEFPVADSITTWRVTALASSQDGRLGSATGGLRVFQDFFIDLDLPGSLTVGDEVAIPVGVFNYLKAPQTVRLELEQAGWFELLDEPVKEIEVAAEEITVVYFRIRAVNFGRQPFQVTAWGSQMSDAIRKDVRVYPDGKELFFSQSDRLNSAEPAIANVTIPAEAIPGTQKLAVKIYPGAVSQVVEGLDALLRMPHGCFEQTSSTTYPNVLVLNYLKEAGQISPEVQMKAEEYVNLGYQRLTTFEVDGDPGGFSLFGEAPADPMLTAYGLQEFGDMSRVHPVDQALIGRIVNWLLAHQNADGSWSGVEGFHETNLTNQTGPIPVTAFVVWGMADAGYANEGGAQRGASYLRESLSQVENAYDMAMVANALVAMDLAQGQISPATEEVLNRLAEMAKREGDSAYWEAGRETYMGGSGSAGDLETTAMAALAFLRANRHPELANAALTTLVKNKDSFGTWETTSATVMALKALLESVKSGSENVDATVVVTVDGGQRREVRVTPENFDVVQLLTFEDVPVGRESVVNVSVEGEGSLMYQVAGSYYLPWKDLPEELTGEPLVSIDVAYDRTRLRVNDTVGVQVRVSLNQEGGVAESAIVDLGVPPGFTVESEDLRALVARFSDVAPDYAGAKVERFELTGRQIIVYVSDLAAGEPLEFSYRLRAQFPLRAQTPASTAYDYYNPSTAGEEQPQLLTVVEETR